MPVLSRAIARHLRDDRGVSVLVVFIVFFPLFLLALVMLIEASRLQSIKTTNDVITHVAANAAVRQADYVAMAEGSEIRLKDGGRDPLRGIDLEDPEQLEALFTDEDPRSGPRSGRGKSGIQLVDPGDAEDVDLVDADNMALIVYHVNANRNGLNAQAGRAGSSGLVSTPPSPGSVAVHNGQWAYENRVLGITGVTSSYPGVEMETRALYTPTPLLLYLTGGEITGLEIRSQAVAQMVPGRSSDR